MKKTSGRGGTRAWPGFTISKPRKLKVRTSLAGRKMSGRTDVKMQHTNKATQVVWMKKGALGKEGRSAHTTIISVLVKADKHTNDFQMFFGILQESCETVGKTGGGLENGTLNMQAQTQQHPLDLWLNLDFIHENLDVFYWYLYWFWRTNLQIYNETMKLEWEEIEAQRSTASSNTFISPTKNIYLYVLFFLFTLL